MEQQIKLLSLEKNNKKAGLSKEASSSLLLLPSILQADNINSKTIWDISILLHSKLPNIEVF